MHSNAMPQQTMVQNIISNSGKSMYIDAHIHQHTQVTQQCNKVICKLQHVNASKQENNTVELEIILLQHGAEPKPSIMYREAKANEPTASANDQKTMHHLEVT